MKKRENNGFTLIELLAVIIILGILMIIAIPSVTKYISDSRKSSYVDTAKELVSGARTFVNEGKVPMYDTSTTYYIDYGCVKTENASKSPYGDFVNAYVVVTYDGKGYTYYWTSVDEAGQGVKIITKADELDEDDIVSDISVAEVAANVALGDTTSTTYINSSCQKQAGEIPVKYASTTGETSFTLTYNNQEGSGCTEQVGEYKKTWGTLCTPTKEGGVSFLGWFTQPNGGGTEVTSSSIVNGNTTVYVKWGIPPVCKRATTLHTATCSRTDNVGCYGAGYYSGGSKNTTTITYGNLGTSGTLQAGDAFDCDVNNDGTFDATTERFYYVTSSGDNAVLIYYTNVTGGITATQSKYAYYASAQENWHGPVTAYEQLPSTTQWSNSGIIAPGTRQITTETGTTSTSGGTIESFTYTNKAARLLTTQELVAGCSSLSRVGIFSTGELDGCNYLMENVGQYKSLSGTYGYWLESPRASLSNGVWCVNGYKRIVGNDRANLTTSHGVRPAITILKSNISY